MMGGGGRRGNDARLTSNPGKGLSAPVSWVVERFTATLVELGATERAYFVFQARLDAGTFIRTSQSRCGNTFQLTK